MVSFTSFLALSSGVLHTVLAHPGHDVVEEAAERAYFLRQQPKGVRQCLPQLLEAGIIDSAQDRRRRLANWVRAKRSVSNNLEARSFADYDQSHASDLDLHFGDDETLLFADDSSNILQPEVTQGPYFVEGELIRSKIDEDEQGVPLFLDIQMFDTRLCQPVPAVFMDLWHANSTGVYSGVSAPAFLQNGNVNDTTNIDKTFLRGVQQTDINGVAQFQTIFPGHYTGRATHIHVITHSPNNTTIRTNMTIMDTNATAHASHIGQLFFDQDLISEVEATQPYLMNTQNMTLNSVDDILNSEANSTDPFVKYIKLGDKIEDGILAWISIGIDLTRDYEVSAAATHHEDGGVTNSHFSLIV